ncbi:MAG: acetate--CoA ligase family protein [Actinobacteria bacterium]|nr:acetate--CoA ligase family protein [Actinomycetota bacterium]
MKESLDYFFNPSSVAVIGATTRTGPGVFNPVDILLDKGYRGKIYPVNPKAQDILGVKSYPSVSDIPGPVDLALISTGRTLIPELVRQCVKSGVRGIIVISQGFADADSKGKELQVELMNAIAGTGVRMLGPNTLGLVNNFDSFITSFIHFNTMLAPVGVICQSGMFLTAHDEIFNGCGYAADIGNAADLGFIDIMEYYRRKDSIKVINLHMEGIRGGKAFLELSRAVTLEKPVIVYKTGRTEEGSRAVGSHSGSLAGEDHVYAAAFRQAGIIRAESIDELRDFNKSLIKFNQVPGNRVAVVTVTGGGGIAVLDAIQSCGLVPALLKPETVAEIGKLLPDWMGVSNPVDFWPAAMIYGFDEVYPQILNHVLSDPGVDILVCVINAYYPPGEKNTVNFNFIIEAAREHPDKLVAVWTLGAAKRYWTQFLEEQGQVVAYDSPERLARALGALYNYHHHIRTRKYDEVIKAGPPAPLTIDIKGMSGAAPGDKAMEILAGAGIPVVKDIFARNLEEAANASAELGYPVALKVVSPQVLHKTEAGGVRLDIRDAQGLKNAYLSMLEEVQEKSPGASIQGVLVQRYLSGGIELILGSKMDAEFGPVLVFGTGGIYTEIMRDVAFRIAPVSPAEALEMIGETRAGRLLQGVRGQEKADLNALVKAITCLSDLVTNNPEISEVDINPLLATSKGVVALDGRVIFGVGS